MAMLNNQLVFFSMIQCNMMIGSAGPGPSFAAPVECREDVCRKYLWDLPQHGDVIGYKLSNWIYIYIYYHQ
jgi:hypothetical protein